MDATLDWAKELILSGERGYICTVNIAMLMMMRSNERLQRFVDSATLAVADGQPLVWYSRLRKTRLPERVTGVDLVNALCATAAREGFGVYFLGARETTAGEAARRMSEKHRGLTVSGSADGYFSRDEAPERARRISESGADILFVSMGVPRQEAFLEDHWAQLGVNLAIPVGGSFEVIAGTRKRAPLFIQKVGLEWFFRLCQEPRRLWKRYLVTNTRFLLLIIADFLRSGRYSDKVALKCSPDRETPGTGEQRERRQRP
jgi:N-acetylglucosaminyldiphosphoundecaprenol N-acetyl-beta-D-mannosaminyltransferase